jgi:hypothetical protein
MTFTRWKVEHPPVDYFAAKIRMYGTEQILLNFVAGTDQQLSKLQSVKLRNIYLAYNTTRFETQCELVSKLQIVKL